jgi:intracellular septation protein
MTNSSDQQPEPAAAEPQVDPQQLTKMLVELGPLVVFFLVNSLTKNLFLGTATFMVATVLALFVSWRWFGRVPVMPLVSGVFVMFFGGLTLWLHDATFIKVKPTIVNGLFASILLVGLFFGQYFLKYILGEVFKLTPAGWRILTIRWALFFVVLAVLNEIVWRNFSEDFWLGFKLFGVLPLTAVFGIAQLGLLRRHAMTPTAA